MPRTLYIRELSKQAAGPGSASRKYLFVGFADAVEVDARVKAFGTPSGGNAEVPYQWAGLPIQLPADIQELGGSVWEVTANYGPRAGQEAVSPGGGTPVDATDHGSGDAGDFLGPEISLSTVGGSKRVTQSIKTRNAKTFNDAASKRNFRGAIGVDVKTGEVAGCDIVSRQLRQTIDLTLPGTAVTAAWLKMVEDATGCINKTTYFGYSPGEFLFLGMTLKSDGASGTFKATMEYEIKRNKTALTIYDNDDLAKRLRLLNVRGWSYVWVIYGQITEVVDGKEQLITVPTDAYEEQVYEEYELNDLLLQKRRPS